MLKDLKENKHGVVFVTVLLVIIVMMIIAISIISLNVSQVLIAEEEVKRIHGEILASGALAVAFANFESDSPGTLHYLPRAARKHCIQH